jgi:large subunit ribosomal protein L4
VVAVRQALSLSATENRVKVIEDINFADGKVKSIAGILNRIESTGRILIVVGQKDDKSLRATNNLPKVGLVYAKNLNVYDVMNSDQIVITKAALDAVHEWLGGKDE